MILRPLFQALILSCLSVLYCSITIANERAVTPQVLSRPTNTTVESSHSQSKDFRKGPPNKLQPISTLPEKLTPMGYCCKNGKITRSTTDVCKKEHGTFYRTEKAATEQCNGYCCSNFTIVKTSQQKCKATQGKFFPGKQQAVQFCEHQKGYCSAGGDILRLTQNQCEKQKGLFFTNYSLARQNILKIKQQALVQKKSGQDLQSTQSPQQLSGLRTTLSDLYLSQRKWSAQPKFGDKIGYSPLLNLTVKNQGTATSSQTNIQIVAEQAPGGVTASDTNILQMSIQIPPLHPGKTFSFAWPQPSEEKWRKGNYRIRLSIPVDPGGESDATNNEVIIYFTCQSNTPMFQATAHPGLSTSINAPLISSSKPDLTVTLQAPDTILYHEFLYTFRGQVSNIGTAIAPKSEVSLGLLGSGVIPVDSQNIPALGTTMGVLPTSIFLELKGTISSSCNGSRQLFLQVDPANLIDEANEDNNIIAFDVECRKPQYLSYDLGLFEKGSQEAYGLKHIGYTHEPVNYSIKVYNFRNNSVSPETQLTVSCDVESDQTVVIKPISASDSTINYREFHFTNSWATNGNYQCQAKLSDVAGFTDSDTSNNQMSFSVQITGHLPGQ
ncbi:CARDB domain-containing protein [Desulfocapsa sulfexigens DSM 10523]|uniref:CARDB domain-containing protein n=1 Tax=Desulfocapsa sulfexigens (strain DSM 10523 / SB164P1) TaxID=1167006 RepID=M1NZQ0_DESSD|nr:CARDB domain-containing protein [Desulfocapsa sulfexigens]AGF76763.1 CARDB domain-containing protein [Desulfocapsa sulfexigens DSM 10523]